METLRSRRHDRVPAHRGDARRAEGAAAPARRWRRSSSTRSCSASRSATCCSPGSSSARRSRTRPGRWRRSCPARRPQPGATRRRRRAVRVAEARRARPGGAVHGCWRRRFAAWRRSRHPRSRSTTSRRSGPACARRSRSSCAVLPETRAAQLPPAGRRRADAARGDRALPRHPRALQAGRRRPRAVRRRSATCACGGCAEGETAARRRPAWPSGTNPTGAPEEPTRDGGLGARVAVYDDPLDEADPRCCERTRRAASSRRSSWPRPTPSSRLPRAARRAAGREHRRAVRASSPPSTRRTGVASCW